MRKLIWGAPILALLLAPTVNADIDHDLQYVNAVDRAGIPFTTREAVIEVGHEICNALTNNLPYTDAVGIITPNLSVKNANTVAALATIHICPSEWYRTFVAQIEFAPQDRYPI